MSDDDDVPITTMVAKRKARQNTRRSMRNRQVEDEDEEENDMPRRRRSSRIKSPVAPEKKKDASEEEDENAQVEEQENEDTTKEKESGTEDDTAGDDKTAETESHEKPEEKGSDDSHEHVVKSADNGNAVDEGNDKQHDQPVETPQAEDVKEESHNPEAISSKGDQNDKVDGRTGIADSNEANATPVDTKEALSSSEEGRMELTKTSVTGDSLTQVEEPKPQDDEQQGSPDDADSLVPAVNTHVDGTNNLEQGESRKSTETGDGEAAAAVEMDTPEHGLNSSNDPMAAPPADTSKGHVTESTTVAEQPVAIETMPTDALTQVPHTAKIAGPEVSHIGGLDTNVAVSNPTVEEATIKTDSVENEHEVDKTNAHDQLAAQTSSSAAEPPNNADKASRLQIENSSLTQKVPSDVKTDDSTKLLKKKSALSVVDDKTVQASLKCEKMQGDQTEVDPIADKTPETTSDQDLGNVPIKIEPSEEEQQKEELDPNRHDVASIGGETKLTGVKGEPRLNEEPVATAPRAPVPLTFKPPTAEETAAVLDAFPDMAKRKNVDRFSDKRPKKRHRQHLCIKIAGIPKAETGAIVPELRGANDPSNILSDILSPDAPSFSGAIVPEWDNKDTASLYERELEDSLAFFSDTHEEQDPIFVEFQQQKEKRRLMNELAHLKKQHEAGVIEINEIIAFQLGEKQASAARNIERLRKKAAMEKESDLHKLHQVYEEKAASNDKKISQGIQLLTNGQSEKMQEAHLQHRQQAHQRGVPEQVISTEWQQIAQRLQAKQQQQLKEFNAKGEEMKKKFEAEYEREKGKYGEHHDKRKRDMEDGMQKVIMRIRSSFQQQRQLYLKRLALRMRQQRDDILLRLGERRLADTTARKDSKEPPEKPELRAPTPVHVRVASNDESESGSPGAAARHAHRKAILGAIHKQLSVEIHNEGLWISTLTEKSAKGEGDKVKTDSSAKDDIRRNDGEFIPWSVKARTVLQSIIVGEIPLGYGTDRFDFGDAVTSQGGHIRCVVVDLRTSEKTASEQRAAAVKEQEAAAVGELEQTAAKLSDAVAVAEKQSSMAIAEERESTSLHEKTRKDAEKARSMMQQLRNKFKHLLTPDDIPLPNMTSSDRNKLSQAISKYSGNLEVTQSRQKAAEADLNVKKARTQSIMTLVKQTQKAAASAASALRKKRAMLSDASRGRGVRLSETAEAERAATRVADVISVLHKTAEGRREQLNQKRSSRASGTWVQALPRLSGALKKSLWYKMHRRMQQIVLRPNMDFVLSDLKNAVEESALNWKGKSALPKNVTREEAMLRAEALFLLSAYPVTNSEIPSVPPSDSSATWAEPGWHVNLDVPKDNKRGSRSLLPRAPSFPVMQNNHSEYCSAPGRQVASLIGTTHLQALNTPLSAVAQAISLAETSPLATETEMAESDPLQISETAMMTGYTFALKSVTRSSPMSQSRKKPTPKDEAEAMVSPSPAKQQALSESAEPKKSSSASFFRRLATKEDKPKRSRSKSSLVAPPRKKTSKTKASSNASAAVAAVVDAASQARNFIQQQAAANALGVRGLQGMQYGQQSQHQRVPQASMDQRQQAYSPGFMKQVQSPSQPSTLQALQPQQMAQQLQPQQLQPQQMPQQLQPQQMSQQMPPQQQLLPQPQYASPQFRGQIAQMRMMQPGFPQQNMRFFAPPMARQQSYGNQQQPPMQLPPQQRRSDQDPTDSLFMLPDMQPP